MTLYIDLILLENIIMNYIIILATGMICRVNIKHNIRIFLSSLLGALYAILTYVVNNIEIYTSQITKIIVSICMVYIAFNSTNVKTMLKQLIIFYLTSFCFGGAAYYLLYNIRPNLIQSSNGILVGTYPIKIAILGGILGFFIINISFKIIKSKLTKKDMLYDIEIFYKENISTIKVILDTGNLLTDPITKTPVLIVEAQKLKNIIPEKILNNIEDVIYNSSFDDVDEDIKIRCSIIPFSSIGKNNGIIIGFRPDYIKIHTNEGEEIRRRVIVGIHNNKITKNGLYSGLIGLNLLNEGEKYEYNSITKK